ncbi:hypothetical protein H6F32_00885 [Anabaena sp. FACHB-1237]|uniref:hypothetical protein n=1 Tax=Anabaena sp. FACHB-1237 TaxID=2692769 RepID=UPI001680CCA6|nr:hypothetical protein [Anabaena sp. FACHB-1237]MBD2136166.1 hypothetical protein [Anabaena sp. FACHB-1237]
MNNIIRSNAIGKVNQREILGIKFSNFAFRRLCNSISSLISLILRTVKTVNLSKAAESIHIGIKNQDNRDQSLVRSPQIKILVSQHQIQEKSTEILGMKMTRSSSKKTVIERLRNLPIARDINILKIFNICHLLIIYGKIQDLIWYLTVRMSNLRLSI